MQALKPIIKAMKEKIINFNPSFLLLSSNNIKNPIINVKKLTKAINAPKPLIKLSIIIYLVLFGCCQFYYLYKKYS